jgi:hypothetical protein
VKILPWRGHPELVMHVLAHVKASARLAASLYDADYLRFAASFLGPAEARPLAEDAALLGRLVPTHRELARLQIYAALFDDPDDDATAALDPTTAARPELWPHLAGLGGALEILRCAVALEKPFLSRLPAVEVAEGALREAVARVEPAAPALADHDLLVVRALRRRGRLFGREIWIGAPSDVAPAQLAWQAAHEATVGEVARKRPDLAERAVESEALVTLAARAAAAGLGRDHQSWARSQ